MHPTQHKCCRCTDQLKLNSDCEMGYFRDGLGCFGDGYLADRRFKIAFKRHCEYATTRANSFGNFLQFLPWHKSTSLNCYGMAGMLIVPISMCLSKSPVNLKAMTQGFQIWYSIDFNQSSTCAWNCLNTSTLHLSTNLRIKSNQSSNDPPSQTLKKKAHKNGRLHTMLPCTPKNFKDNLGKTQKQQTYNYL